MIGDGKRVSSQGLCEGLRVNLGSCEVVVDGYLFGLGGVDLTLGVAWLQTLGEVKVDWSNMSMKFTKGGEEMILP